MKSKSEISSQFRKHLHISQKGLSNQYKSARECMDAYAGDTANYRDRTAFFDARGRQRNSLVEFNKIKPYVNAIAGYFTQIRRKVRYIAKKDDQAIQKIYSQYANSIADYIRSEANADANESQQDKDVLINGYGATETYLSYMMGRVAESGNGTVGISRIHPLHHGWDPQARKTNLLDSRWHYVRTQYPIDEAMDLMDDDDRQHYENASETSDEGNDYTYYPGGGKYDRIRENLDVSDEDQDLVNVYYYQWYQIEDFYRANNPILSLHNPTAIQMAQMSVALLAEEQEEDDPEFNFDPLLEKWTFNGDLKTKLEEIFGEYLVSYKFKRKVYYHAVISGRTVFQAYRSPEQQGYTIKIKTGDWDETRQIWTGLVNSMINPMLYYNKALTGLLLTIVANSKGGAIAEENAIDDIQQFEQQWAKTDGIVTVKDGAIDKVRSKKEPFQPTGYDQIIGLTDAALVDVTGVDKSFLGSSENKNETAQLQRQRVRQITACLACYVDSINLYQKEHALLLLDFMRIYADHNDGSLFHMVDENERRIFTRISREKLDPEYDIDVAEVLPTPEERGEMFKVCADIGTALLTSGDAATAKKIIAIGFKYSASDPAWKQQMIEALTPDDPKMDPSYINQLEQQVQQLQQQLQIVDNKITDANVQKLGSETAVNIAKIAQMQAQNHKIKADSVRTLEDSRKISLETDLAAKYGSSDIRVNL